MREWRLAPKLRDSSHLIEAVFLTWMRSDCKFFLWKEDVDKMFNQYVLTLFIGISIVLYMFR
ncbi:hypothetical protein HanLR1_Chr11g0396211 [Helianthus annuus]|nr:hypothetical protein HanHA89_Chr11g0418781 [Helianthus annuus]KAJ0684884.1 hypothetical protein HanLR1_Chr11g0396211 [Helianthus annuus]